MKIYRDITGDRDLKNFWCPAWSPEEQKREPWPTVKDCEENFGTLDRQARKTFRHDLFVFPIRFVHRICPTTMSAIVQGLTIAVYTSVGLMTLFMICGVCGGYSKKLSKTSGTLQRAMTFPTPIQNFRDIVELRLNGRARRAAERSSGALRRKRTRADRRGPPTYYKICSSPNFIFM